MRDEVAAPQRHVLRAPGRPDPERPAARHPAFPDRRGSDADLRRDGLRQPRPWRAIHGRRLFRRHVRVVDGRVLGRARLDFAGRARLRACARIPGFPLALRPRPPLPDSRDLRHHPVPEPGGEDGLGRGAAQRSHARGPVGERRAHAGPALPGLPHRADRRGPRDGAGALPADQPHAGRDAHPRGRDQRRDGLGARRRHPPAVHARLRLRRHARGLRRARWSRPSSRSSRAWATIS